MPPYFYTLLHCCSAIHPLEGAITCQQQQTTTDDNIAMEELDKEADEREVWVTLLRLLPHQISGYGWMDESAALIFCTSTLHLLEVWQEQWFSGPIFLWWRCQCLTVHAGNFQSRVYYTWVNVFCSAWLAIHSCPLRLRGKLPVMYSSLQPQPQTIHIAVWSISAAAPWGLTHKETLCDPATPTQSSKGSASFPYCGKFIAWRKGFKLTLLTLLTFSFTAPMCSEGQHNPGIDGLTVCFDRSTYDLCFLTAAQPFRALL